MKRKRRVKSWPLDSYEILKRGRDVVYLCMRCPKAWRYPEAITASKVSGLLAHAETHNSHTADLLQLAKQANAEARGE